MRKALFLVFIAGVAVWLAGCGDSKKPVVQPQISSFAFMQDAGGYLFTPMLGKYATTGATTVFTTYPVLDSSTNQPVTAEFYSIALSPYGSKAVVDLYGGQNGDSGQWDIFIADSDDRGNMMAVTNDAYLDALPQFSADATKVIFNSERPGPKDSNQWQIVTRRTDGSGEVVLPMPLGADQTWAPTYSPDGSKIAVEAWGYDSLGNFFDGIVTMKADGSSPKLLTNPAAVCDCYDENPAFTADGRKIVFSGESWDPSTSTETEDIYIMNADGTGVTQLTSGMGINFDPLAVNIIGVGPRILFSSSWGNADLSGSGAYELYSMKLDGTELTRLTTNTLYDSFSSERYEGQTASAQTARRLHASHHRLPLGRNVGHKVRW
jgi:Tol biopolymer transport system component